MAASFLQYCAMCEKQITTPMNSILYCSQACRRKDATKPLSASILPSADTPPRSRPSSPLRSTTSSATNQPTTPLGSPIPALQIPTDSHAHKQDLDPTEWKPKLRAAHNSDLARRSEAYRYLASFHAGTIEHEHGGRPAGLPLLHHSRMHSTSMSSVPTVASSAMPSLDSKVTTAASSYDSALLSSEGAGNYFEYDYARRPLQARSDPLYQLSGGLRSEELVVPHIPPPVVGVLSGSGCGRDGGGSSEGGMWEKKKIVVVKGKAEVGREKEGLGRLLA